MNRYLALAALLAVPAQAGELPMYESMGFPMTPAQLSVVNSTHIQELLPTPTQAGLPASPHQIAVLTPRPRATDAVSAATLTKARLSPP